MCGRRWAFTTFLQDSFSGRGGPGGPVGMQQEHLKDVRTHTVHLGGHLRRIGLPVHVGLSTGRPTAHMAPAASWRSGA